MTNYPADTFIPLPAMGQWPAAVHRFGVKAAAALRAAEATNRPLLIRGRPGVGKSMTARAAAGLMRRPLLARVIDGRTEADDLKARYDTLRRLADAQVRRGPGSAPLAAPNRYLSPQELWWAFDWPSAMKQHTDFTRRLLEDKASDEEVANTAHDTAPTHPDRWDPKAGRVVMLLDEIDKAEPDMPNALLEVLGSNGFVVPQTGQVVSCEPQRRPLIVITTNEERELSSAFLRRCLVLWLALPEGEDELVAELVAIGHQHQEYLVSEAVKLRAGRCLVIEQAARRLAAARSEALLAGGYAPGTSEFLDLVAALAELHPDDAQAQQQALDTLQEFVLNKSVQGSDA